MRLSPLIMESRAFLRELTPDGTILVLVKEGLTGEMIMRAAKGPAANLDEGSPTRILLDKAEAENTATLILDAYQDALLKDLSPPFRSALCVPVNDPEGRLVGVLYADDLSAGRFSYANRTEAQEFAQELGEALLEVDWEEVRRPPPPPPPKKPPLPKPIRAAIALFVLAGLWMVVGGLIMGWEREEQQAQAREEARAAQVSEPLTMARGLLSLLQTQDYRSARDRLTPRLRDRVPGRRFEEAMQKWWTSGDNAKDVQHREVTVKEEAATSAVIEVRPVGGEGRRPWLWTLVNQGRGWQLDAAQEGPPLTSVE